MCAKQPVQEPKKEIEGATKVESLGKSSPSRSKGKTFFLFPMDPSFCKKSEEEAPDLSTVLKTISENAKNIYGMPSNPQFMYLANFNPQNDASHYLELTINVTYINEDSSFLITFEETKAYYSPSSFVVNSEKFLDNLLLTISHELHTPLGVNISLLNKALKQSELPAHCKENFIKPALISAKLLHYVVCDIVDFLNLSNESLQLKVKPVNLEVLLKHCVSLMKDRAKLKNIQMITNFELRNKIIKTDKSKLSRIVVNLLTNALKFTSHGTIKLSAITMSNGVKITVEDDGIGITLHTQKKIEEILYSKYLGDRPSTNSSGIGLGLFIANELVNILNPSGRDSRISFESEEGIGSKFSFSVENLQDTKTETILLDEEGIDSLLSVEDFRTQDKLSYNMSFPEATDAPARMPVMQKIKTLGFKNSLYRATHAHTFHNFASSSPKNEDIEDLSSNTEFRCPNILVVDDEPFNILAMEVWLKELDCSYHSITQSTEVINHVKEAYSKISRADYFYKMIVLDINMPSISGIEIAQELTRLMESKTIPRVVLVAHSAYPKEQYEEICKEVGIEHYLQKPLRKVHLVNLVKKIMKKEQVV